MKGRVLKAVCFAQAFDGGAHGRNQARRQSVFFKTVGGAGQRFAETQTVRVRSFDGDGVEPENGWPNVICAAAMALGPRCSKPPAGGNPARVELGVETWFFGSGDPGQNRRGRLQRGGERGAGFLEFVLGDVSHETLLGSQFGKGRNDFRRGLNQLDQYAFAANREFLVALRVQEGDVETRCALADAAWGETHAVG